MSLESSMALKKLGSSMRTMTRTSSIETHIANSKAAVKSLNSLLQSSLWKETDFLSIIPAVTVASLLIDIVDCTQEIADSVHVLASLINFDTFNETENKSLKEEALQSPTCECLEPTSPKIENNHIVIQVEDSDLALSDRGNLMSDKCNKI